MKSLIILGILIVPAFIYAKPECDSKFRRLKIKLDVATLKKVEDYTPRFIKDKPSCEADVIETARYLRTQFADKMSVKYLFKYDGKKPLDEVLPLKKEELDRYGFEIGQNEGSYFIADRETYYLRFKTDQLTEEGRFYSELVKRYSEVVIVDDGALKTSFPDVARLLIQFESFARENPEYQPDNIIEKVAYMRRVLAGLLDNSPCFNRKKLRIVESCAEALNMIVNLEDEIPSQKIFEPIMRLANTSKKSKRKKAAKLLKEVALKGQ